MLNHWMVIVLTQLTPTDCSQNRLYSIARRNTRPYGSLLEDCSPRIIDPWRKIPRTWFRRGFCSGVWANGWCSCSALVRAGATRSHGLGMTTTAFSFAVCSQCGRSLGTPSQGDETFTDHDEPMIPDASMCSSAPIRSCLFANGLSSHGIDDARFPFFLPR